MKIAMFTNLYRPIVGGVTLSIIRFGDAFRRAGHEVLVVAPDYPGQPGDEPHVVRVPAIQEFHGTDFSLALPPGQELTERLRAFDPDIIHSHHPFLLGAAAVRAAAHHARPLVYTHHTMYEYYTHYLPVDSRTMRNFVVHLATRYAEFCSRVIAPSESVASILRRRGVDRPITVAPTGVVLDDFAGGDGAAARQREGIDAGAFVIGHVGRLAEEKNLTFLTRAVMDALEHIPGSVFVVVGSGDQAEGMKRMLAEAGLGDRVIFTGTRTGEGLTDLYAAMDLFVFASKSETQGMVLAEAMAAGTPTVALDAPGAREVVQDGRNGRIVKREQPGQFAKAIRWIHDQPAPTRRQLVEAARTRAEQFSLDACAAKVLEAYEQAIAQPRPICADETDGWGGLGAQLRQEWRIWANRFGSLSQALAESEDPRD